MRALTLIALFAAQTALAQAPQGVTSNCTCADGRQLSIGDLMRSTEADRSADPDKEWRGYQTWNQIRSTYGKIQALQSAGPVCPGALTMDWASRDGRKFNVSTRLVGGVNDLCALAQLEGGTARARGQEAKARLSDLAEAGELDSALNGAPARGGVPVSPYPRALGPFTPGQAVYAIEDGHGASRGQMGFVLGPSKDGQLVDVGFYCKRVSVMETLGGLGVGAFFSDAHRRCKKSVAYSQLAATSDNPPHPGAP